MTLLGLEAKWDVNGAEMRQKPPGIAGLVEAIDKSALANSKAQPTVAKALAKESKATTVAAAASITVATKTAVTKSYAATAATTASTIEAIENLARAVEASIE